MKQHLLIAVLGIAGFSLTSRAQTDSLEVKGGYNIHYLKKGIGAPAIVFVSGMAHDHETWQIVQDTMAKTNLTVSYDRAGLGKTEFNGQKKDLLTIADELYQLIVSLKLPTPVVLVGHSMGCQVIRQFAAAHPNDVKAVVFVDPGYNPDKLKAIISDSLWQVREETLKRYMPKLNAGQQAEFDNIVRNSEIADAITNYPDVPTEMLTATLVTDFPASAIEIGVKRKSHENWLRSLPSARHIIVTSTWHYIHTDTPGEVIKAIRSVEGKRQTAKGNL